MKKKLNKRIKDKNKRTNFNIFKVNNKFSFSALLQNLIIPLAGSFLVSFFIRNSEAVYNEIKKPFFSPPSIVFPIVWTILYIMMGFAAYRIFMKNKSGAKGNGYLLYLIQLAINLIWSFVFFKLKLYGLAFILAVVLLILVIITTVKFFKVDKIAGYFMIPYIIWLSFASVLSYYVWVLNEM